MFCIAKRVSNDRITVKLALNKVHKAIYVVKNINNRIPFTVCDLFQFQNYCITPLKNKFYSLMAMKKNNTEKICNRKWLTSSAYFKFNEITGQNLEQEQTFFSHRMTHVHKIMSF
jgi:hypothetical protein